MTHNVFLEKIAQTNKRSNEDRVQEALLVGGGGLMAKEAPSHLLGYHKVFHGTPRAEAAESIKREGLRKHYGGTTGSHVGEGAVKDAFTATAKEHVYVTKSPLTAATFAGDSAKHINTYGHANPKALTESLKQYIKGEGKVLKARIPHSMWEHKLELDPDSFDLMTRMSTPHDALKARAARSKEDIDSKYFKGGSKKYSGRGYGLGSYMNSSNLKEYYGTKSGRSRAKIGAGLLAAGLGSAGLGAGLNIHRGGILSQLKGKKDNE